MSDPLVTTDWLAEHLDEPDVQVVDATWYMPNEDGSGRADYDAGHIPGAVFFDIDEIADHATDLPHMLPTPDAFAQAAGALGLRRAAMVVVYDARGVFSAPRVWWTLRAMGFPRVFVLDGGLKRWRAEGRPLETEPAAPAATQVSPGFDRSLVRDLNEVRDHLKQNSAQLVDARSAGRFRGETPEPRADLRSGHTPGACNVPWNGLVGEDGSFKSRKELQAVFAAGGVDLTAPIVTTCGSGVTAALLALGLARLGRADVAVYDGAWTEWGGRSDTPVVTGAEPMETVEALFRRATQAQRMSRYGEAVELYREVLKRSPGLDRAEQNLCLALLGAGELGEGFRRYDVRFERAVGRVPKPALSFPEWRGEPLAGRSILIWMEQGFGDQIMFARFASVLASMGATVSILTPPPLARLFASLPAEIIEASGQVSIPRHDYWISPGSIPGRLGVTEETLPREPYLPGSTGGSGVGIAWRGDPRHPNDAHRSLPPLLGAELLALRDAVSLQPEDSGAADFAETAAIIRGLALVITADTALAHLAGAMGKPTWVLLPAENCDWRWQGGREDSPWYPSVRLFRQPAPGDWGSVIAAVRTALRREQA